MGTSGWLQRHRVTIYAASVLLAVCLGVKFPSGAPLFGQAITSVLAVLLYVTFLEFPSPNSVARSPPPDS